MHTSWEAAGYFRNWLRIQMEKRDRMKRKERRENEGRGGKDRRNSQKNNTGKEVGEGKK